MLNISSQGTIKMKASIPKLEVDKDGIPQNKPLDNEEVRKEREFSFDRNDGEDVAKSHWQQIIQKGSEKNKLKTSEEAAKLMKDSMDCLPEDKINHIPEDMLDVFKVFGNKLPESARAKHLSKPSFKDVYQKAKEFQKVALMYLKSQDSKEKRLDSYGIPLSDILRSDFSKTNKDLLFYIVENFSTKHIPDGLLTFVPLNVLKNLQESLWFLDQESNPFFWLSERKIANHLFIQDKQIESKKIPRIDRDVVARNERNEKLYQKVSNKVVNGQ